MKKTVGGLLRTAGGVLSGAGGRLTRTDFDRELARWNRSDGERTHRLDYDLDERSLVLDVGGYHGQWASDIYAMYQPTIHIVEPVKAFADGLRKRFARNPKITVHALGLAPAAGTAELYLDANQSSLYLNAGKGAETITLVQANTWFASQRIDAIDLLKIHTEGAEYDLIEHLIDTGWIGRIRDLQVQFHDYAPNALTRLAAIRERLSTTHALTYQYSMVFENWHRRAGGR